MVVVVGRFDKGGRGRVLYVLPPTINESLMQFFGALNYSLLARFSCKLQQVSRVLSNFSTLTPELFFGKVIYRPEIDGAQPWLTYYQNCKILNSKILKSHFAMPRPLRYSSILRLRHAPAKQHRKSQTSAMHALALACARVLGNGHDAT